MAKKTDTDSLSAALRIIAVAWEKRSPSLNLSNLGLTALPPEVGSLAALTTLDLRNNRLVTLPPEVGSLTALTKLDLGGNRLVALPSEVGCLTALTALYLNNNLLAALPPEVGSLTALTRLDLSGNRLVALPSEVGCLTALTALYLNNNLLAALPPEIGFLTALTELYVNNNPLAALPPEIGSLATLTTLVLSNNRLAALPPEVGSLTALTTLSLGGNLLAALPPTVGSLTALTALSLGGNLLADLPPEIGSLTALTELYVNNNLLTALPSEVGYLTALTELYLSNNRLAALPPDVGCLTALTVLSLGGNLLATLPPEIGSLVALTTLDLSNNRLAALPLECGRLASLKHLYLHENVMLGLPQEMLGPTFSDVARRKAIAASPQAILEYYFKSASGARALREVKLILVGRGEVGKTTLADALQGKAFVNSRPRTDGVSITPWPITPKGGDAIVRIWDFGGQEIMHGTHQFFLTRRAIYVVMVDGRDDRYQREAEYWLKLVRAFGGDSTVMVLMNRQANYTFDLDRNALATKYGVKPDLFFATECSKRSTLTAVRQTIFRIVGELLSTQANFPAQWWAVKTALENMKEDYLSDPDYRTLCRHNGVVDKREQDQLLDRLNDLGTIVHFPEDRLADLTVLDPEWATDGVYRVVTDVRLREEKHGKLRTSALKDILSAERWPQALHRQYILNLMLKFDLCFRAEDEDDVYFVPELLPEQTPNLSGWHAKDGVVFRYEYPILPHGIVPRFISKTHRRSEGQHRWRSGVVVTKDGAEALIRGDYDASTVDIWVRGPHRNARRALLSIVREKFDAIHSRFKELNPIEWVGLPRDPTVFVAYQDMILDERDGKSTVRVTLAGRRVDEPLEDILSGVESAGERQIKADILAGLAESNNRDRDVPVHVPPQSKEPNPMKVPDPQPPFQPAMPHVVTLALVAIAIIGSTGGVLAWMFNTVGGGVGFALVATVTVLLCVLMLAFMALFSGLIAGTAFERLIIRVLNSLPLLSSLLSHFRDVIPTKQVPSSNGPGTPATRKPRTARKPVAK
jgi:internalin A